MIVTSYTVTKLKDLISLVKSKANAKFVEAVELSVAAKHRKCPRSFRCSTVILGCNANSSSASLSGIQPTQLNDGHQEHDVTKSKSQATQSSSAQPNLQQLNCSVPLLRLGERQLMQNTQVTSFATKNLTSTHLSQLARKDGTPDKQPTNDKRVQFTFAENRPVTIVVGNTSMATDVLATNILNTLNQVAKAKPLHTTLKAMVGRIFLRSTMGQSVDITEQILGKR